MHQYWRRQCNLEMSEELLPLSSVFKWIMTTVIVQPGERAEDWGTFNNPKHAWIDFSGWFIHKHRRQIVIDDDDSHVESASTWLLFRLFLSSCSLRARSSPCPGIKWTTDVNNFYLVVLSCGAKAKIFSLRSSLISFDIFFRLHDIFICCPLCRLSKNKY